MLALLLKVGEKLCAIPARSVVEVVPKVELRSTPESLPWLAGLFAYRGAILPVVDLCMRVEGRPCESLLSSRIVVVLRSSGRPGDAYGLLSESVTDVKEIKAGSAQGTNAELASYVQSAVLQDGQLIHLLDVDKILPPPASDTLRLGGGA